MQLRQVELNIDGERLVCEYALAERMAVILHGAGKSNRKRYYAMAQELLRRGVGVVVFDFSGHGNSSGELGELSLARRERQTRAVIDALVPREARLYLIGFSMGGQTVCDVLDAYGARTEAVLLGCPGIYSAVVEDLSFGDGAFTSGLREPNSWAKSSAPAALGRFDGRTIIAYGGSDEVVPRGIIDLMRGSARDLTYVEYPDVGHQLAAWLGEHPEAMAGLLDRLVARGEAPVGGMMGD